MALKIIFMGTPNFAVPILKSLYESKHKILEVYTQPPTKKNRGLKIQNSPIHEFSKKLNIPVRHPISFKNNNEIEHIKKLNPDIVIVVAYGILPLEEAKTFTPTLVFPDTATNKLKQVQKTK